MVVYKVDRLTRSLADFAKLVELFDPDGVSFVSVTQSFNTTTSMGRLTLNVLLSFAQFEREVIGSPRAIPSRCFAVLGFQPAEGLLLNVPAEEPRQDVLAEGRRRGRPEGRAP